MGLTHLHCGYQIICELSTLSLTLLCWSQPRPIPFLTESSLRLLPLSLTVNPSLKSLRFLTPKLTNVAKHANCCTSYNGQAMKAPTRKPRGSLPPSLIMHPSLYLTFTSPTWPNQALYRFLNSFSFLSFFHLNYSKKSLIHTLLFTLCYHSSLRAIRSYFLQFLFLIFSRISSLTSL